MEILGQEKVEKVDVNIFNDTVMENHQTAQGKTTELNGIVNFRQLATIISRNHNLGDMYVLQFKAVQEAMSEKELNVGVVKKATHRAQDQVELPVNTGISETQHSKLLHLQLMILNCLLGKHLVSLVVYWQKEFSLTTRDKRILG